MLVSIIDPIQSLTSYYHKIINVNRPISRHLQSANALKILPNDTFRVDSTLRKKRRDIKVFRRLGDYSILYYHFLKFCCTSKQESAKFESSKSIENSQDINNAYNDEYDFSIEYNLIRVKVTEGVLILSNRHCNQLV
jgi:hypothetical protein